MTTLKYIFESSPFHFSLSPLDVDRAQNTVLMKSLSSTLLTIDKSLRPVPNLASKWENTSDYKTWDFYLKKNLQCDEGKVITNIHFIKTFNWILKIQSERNSSIPVFSKLIGWENFIKKTSAQVEGLTILPDNGIRFSFNSAIDPGILDFLSIPQFSFYCESNFDSNGKWIQVNSIVSSGDYSLNSFGELGNGETVILEKRDNWTLAKSKIFSKVILTQSPKESLNQIETDNVIIIRHTGIPEDVPSKFKIIEGAKIQLVSIVLSPYINNVFHHKYNRQLFKKNFYKWLELNPLNESRYYLTRNFYPESTFSKLPEKVIYEDYQFLNHKKIKVSIVTNTNIPDETRELIINGIKASMPYEHFEFYKELLNRNDPHSIKKYLSNRDYDIRINWGVIASMSNWIIDMMFCSNIGMCLPDANDRVCELVKAQNAHPMDISIYSENFNEIIRDESSIIPIYHTGSMWILGNGVDANNLSPLLPIPYLENLYVK